MASVVSVCRIIMDPLEWNVCLEEPGRRSRYSGGIAGGRERFPM
jgi:hypothetical protein